MGHALLHGSTDASGGAPKTATSRAGGVPSLSKGWWPGTSSLFSQACATLKPQFLAPAHFRPGRHQAAAHTAATHLGVARCERTRRRWPREAASLPATHTSLPRRMELSDSHITALKLVVGIAATGASRHYFAKRQLWPWRVRQADGWMLATHTCPHRIHAVRGAELQTHGILVHWPCTWTASTLACGPHAGALALAPLPPCLHAPTCRHNNL